jgi:glycosyltransferase involved in cell wall biosynthesis
MHFLPFFEFNLSTILFCLFAIVALTQLFYTLFIYGRLSFFTGKKAQKSDNFPNVSILISARNESDNLYENLPLILEQDYPNFEVIVINHQSVDDSYHILNAYAHQYKNLKIIEIERSQHLKPGKKLPLTLGIKGAKYEHLFFTDADCRPASNQWLKSMAQYFTNGKEIVLGYAPYTKKPGYLNKLIRFDTTWIAMTYFSMALAKLPYMGVGRNLAYTRSLFDSVNGYKSHYSITSGDDDLFIQETVTKQNFAINLDPASFCFSEGSTNWENWYMQKTRHFTTSGRYDVFKKAMLGIYPFTMLIFTISFVILMFDDNFRWLTLSGYVFVVLIKWWIQAKCFIKLKQPSFIALLPLYDLAYAIFVPILYYTTDKKEIRKW